MFTLRKRLVRHLEEPTQTTADVRARIERLRALSVHDKELARLLDEIEPHFGSRPDASSKPTTGTRLDLN